MSLFLPLLVLSLVRRAELRGAQQGDKDMFRFAFLALRKRWGVPGRYVSVGALPRNSAFLLLFSPVASRR